MKDDPETVYVSMSGLGKDKRFKMNLILPRGKFDQIKRESRISRSVVLERAATQRSLGSISV